MEYKDVCITGKWYALFSHTGKEIADIGFVIGRKPDVILTDSDSYGRYVDADVDDTDSAIQKYLQSVLTPNDLVTLHGYLGVIRPETLATGARFWNGHPALSPLYPELEGLDPQKKFFDYQKEKLYPLYGSIIHEVTEEIDRGPLIYVTTKAMPVWLVGRASLNEITLMHKHTSLETWVKVLKEVFLCQQPKT